MCMFMMFISMALAIAMANSCIKHIIAAMGLAIAHVMMINITMAISKSMAKAIRIVLAIMISA